MLRQTFLLWKSAISSSSALLCSSTTLFSSATVCGRQAMSGSAQFDQLGFDDYLLHLVKLGVQFLLCLLQLCLFFFDPKGAICKELVNTSERSKINHQQHSVRGPENKLLPHLLLPLLKRLQVRLAPHCVRLREAARLRHNVR